MPARLKYGQLAPQGLGHMSALEHYLNAESGLDPVLLGLVRLRASLMNGCEYCIHLHGGELKKLDQSQERISSVADWRTSSLYTDRERAALVWTEALTDIQDGHASNQVYLSLREHFNDLDTVNLTLTITTINAWNRIAIALGNYPGHVGSPGSAP